MEVGEFLDFTTWPQLQSDVHGPQPPLDKFLTPSRPPLHVSVRATGVIKGESGLSAECKHTEERRF